jgi:hypothetical protein
VIESTDCCEEYFFTATTASMRILRLMVDFLLVHVKTDNAGRTGRRVVEGLVVCVGKGGMETPFGEGVVGVLGGN